TAPDRRLDRLEEGPAPVEPDEILGDPQNLPARQDAPVLRLVLLREGRGRKVEVRLPDELFAGRVWKSGEGFVDGRVPPDFVLHPGGIGNVVQERLEPVDGNPQSL